MSQSGGGNDVSLCEDWQHFDPLVLDAKLVPEVEVKPKQVVKPSAGGNKVTVATSEVSKKDAELVEKLLSPVLASNEPRKIVILKRNPDDSSSPSVASKGEPARVAPEKTLEQREKEYQEARARIFGETTSTTTKPVQKQQQQQQKKGK